ncbi:MAG: UBP-type zinc finger domain-containing protein [Leifsonia sp.]
MDQHPDIDPSVPPGSDGCAACDRADGWWLHLRRCATCGTVGCCDSSPSQHARAHFEESGHRVVRSFEPGESWFWDFELEDYSYGPELADPQAHPADQPTPGPDGRVPAGWKALLNG